MMEKIKENNKLLIGGLWTSAARWSVKFIGLLSTLIIVRILIPEDFGIILKAILVFGPLERFAQIGFSETLLRIKKPEQSHYHTAFTLNILLGGVLTAFLFFSAEFWAGLLKQQEIIILLMILCVKLFATSCVNPRLVELQRDFCYKKDFFVQILNKVFTVGMTLIGTIYYENFLGPIIGQTLGMIFFVAMSYYMIPMMPALSLKNKKEMIAFSVPNMRAGGADYILQNIDRLLLARFVAVPILGLYNLAVELAEQFTTEIIYPLARAFFPVFAEAEGEQDHLKNLYISSLTFLIPLCLAVGVGLAFIAKPFILLYAGDAWYDAAEFLEILSIAAAAQSFCLVNSTVLGATGHIKKRAFLTVAHAILSLLCMFPYALNADVMAVIYIKAILGILFAVLNIGTVIVVMQLPWFRVLSILLRSTLALLMMGAALNLLSVISPLLDVLMSVIVGGAVFCMSLMILWFMCGMPDGAERKIYSACKKVFKI